MCFTGTWLKSDTADNLLVNSLDYSVYRHDRFPESCGGGVCILLNNRRVTAVQIPIPTSYNNVELIAVDLLNCSTGVRLFVCYRPPGHDNDPFAKAYIYNLCACVESLMPRNSTIIICGDLNFPSIDWTNIDPILSASDIRVLVFL